MKAYVINLAAETDRLAHMRETLSRIGVSFQRFDALDPDRAVKHPCFSLIPPMPLRPWATAEIACLLSHYQVWRLIANGPDEFGMVLEDDLIVDPRLKDIYDGAAGIPRDADLVKLETGEYEIVALSHRSVSTAPGLAYHRLLSLHQGSGAYIVSRKAAQTLIGSVASFNLPVDWLLFGPSRVGNRPFRRYQSVPAVAIQNVNLSPGARLAHVTAGMDHVRENAWQRATPKQMAERDAPDRRFSTRLRRLCLRLFAQHRLVPFGGMNPGS